MGRAEGLFRHLADGLALEGEAVPGQTLLELLGEDRVLVENHRGILQYSLDQVTVGTTFGCVTVRGEDLTLTSMSGSQLILSGGIWEITLARREKP